MRGGRLAFGRFRLPRILVCAACAAWLAPGGSWAAKGDRLPYRVGMDVRYGDQRGPESWRDEFEFRVLDYLDRQACFRSVRAFDEERPGETDLLLRVWVSHVEEEQRFDVSQADLTDPDAPPEVSRQFTIQLEADFDVEFRKLPEDVVLRAKNMSLRSSYRPRFDEDARYEVRIELIEDLERELASMICKGNEKRLAKDLKKALAAAERRSEKPPSR
jgi:hypothetical protein